jgi:8-oxo-dGTP pyrophosphatase MutT (NUDIX family)
MVPSYKDTIGSGTTGSDPGWVIEATSEILDRSPWLKVWQQRIRLPSGRTIPDYIITKTPSYAMIFPITPDGQVVMVEQYKHGLRRWTLDLPAGYLEEDDPSPLVAAQRELLEETGYGGGEWQSMGDFVVDTNRSGDQACLFLARNVTLLQDQSLDELEDIRVQCYPLAEVMGLIQTRQVVSLASVAGLLLGVRTVANPEDGANPAW